VSVAEEGATPAPYILDASVLTAIARADVGIATLMQVLDAQKRPVVIPALAITGASLAARSDEADELLEGLELFDVVTVAPLRGAEQALALAAVTARTGLDPWDSHVAAVADASACRILTLDAAKWRQHEHDLDERLHFTEIADPDESGQ
jgi:hypothetical protein